jgi:histidinol dehydrogenase
VRLDAVAGAPRSAAKPSVVARCEPGTRAPQLATFPCPGSVVYEGAMPIRLDSRTPDFAERFRAFLSTKREAAADVEAAVRAIIADVAARGDQALLELSRTFDRLDLAAVGLRVSPGEIDAAHAACERRALDALMLARDRVEAFHRRQLPRSERFTDALGVELGHRWTAIEAVGLYVPGGTAAYPSSVLMNAVPAKVAGVPRIVMVVPAPDGKLSPLVLAAAKLAGVDEVYRVGGAQAVAALAYGTATISPVAKIVGPGNAYVAAAKRLVFGKVGIDMIAGPSEVLILADKSGHPDWIAADLLAQAEHDASAQAILITDDAALAAAVEQAVSGQLASLPRAAVAGASWRDFGAVIMVETLAQAVPLVDAIAPEHLEIESEDAEGLAGRIRNAGAIFLGPHTPEAIGDYVGGTNHVLPTARSARFSSGLGVLDFMKRTSILKCGPDQLRALAGAAIALGEAEGLDAHARSVAMRFNP